MRQAEFEQRHQRDWARLERWLQRRALRPAARKAMQARLGESDDALIPAAEFPARYRALCAHLALARERHYTLALVDRLHALVQAGHQALYGAQTHRSEGLGHFLMAGFPRLVRAQWRMLALASALFFGPLLAMLVAVQFSPELAETVLAPHKLGEYEMMYRREADRLGQREASSSVQMFGFYIYNNVRIGFQTFAGGIAWGLGSVFFLVYNGVVIGTVLGHLSGVGLGPQIWSFVSGHSALELVAIAISGAAGLKLGAALIAPGRRSRRLALVQEGRIALQLAGGAGLMFLAAAAMEAFWSPWVLDDPRPKYALGVFAWLLLAAYLGWGGRRAA